MPTNLSEADIQGGRQFDVYGEFALNQAGSPHNGKSARWRIPLRAFTGKTASATSARDALRARYASDQFRRKGR
jgi:hypothetical protein